jgi:hypothetical protein
MGLERRDFLKGLSAGAVGLPFLPHLAQSIGDRLGRLAADVEAATGTHELWRRVREEFHLEPGLTHLNCGSLGATPRLVLDAVTSAMREVEGDPATKTFSWGGAQMEEVRARAAGFIGADLEEVALTRNTTEGMNAVAGGARSRSWIWSGPISRPAPGCAASARSTPLPGCACPWRRSPA